MEASVLLESRMFFTNMTAEEMDELVDYAHRSSLLKYNDGRLWYFLTDEAVPLGQLAWAVTNNKVELLKTLAAGNGIFITKSIRNIPGDDFLCLYHPDVCFLKPYRSEGNE